MKTFRISVSYLLVVAVFTLTMPSFPEAAVSIAQTKSGKQDKQRRVKSGGVKSGPEVAVRVRTLKERDKNVRAAFRAFEKKGRAPKLDEATAITGEFYPEQASKAKKGNGMLQPANFTAQDQTTVSGDGYELVLIPSLVVDGEWQGTAIYSRYDGNGNVVEQYTENIVTVADSNGDTKVMYEIIYDNGSPYLLHQPGMYAGFSFGKTIQEHQTYFGTPPPVEVVTEQFILPDYEVEYEQLYGVTVNPDPFGAPPPCLTFPCPEESPVEESPVSDLNKRRSERVNFRRTGFQFRSDLGYRHANRPPHTGPTYVLHPNVSNYFINVGLGCTTAVFCGSDVRCRAVACGGSAIINLPKLFGR